MDSVAGETSKFQMISSLLEPLENRGLLSGVGWPTAPFASTDVRATIYVNQNGNAVLNRSASVGLFGGYNLYYDDSGSLSIHTNGAAADLAFYSKSGRPTSVDTDGSAGLINVQVPEDKRMQYIGVRPRASGSYQLKIDGPRATFIQKIPISKVLNAGASGSDISGDGDYDFYRFTIPRSGNWEVKVIPDPKQYPLDATMNVFNVRGRPVGGSYTRTINKGGPGVTEHWLGIGLSAGATYLLRVDGAGASLGGYGVSVSLALGPDVSISATDAIAGHKYGDGQFKVVRTDNSRKPLTVRYKITGTAIPGVDYTPLSGLVTIARNQLWASILINPLLGAGDDKTVVLTLLPADGFSLYPDATATVRIR